ncbi:MAG: autoinducer 2 ABC transporter substrate-binding protein [Christensenellaceae bacterium]|jgi:simple sugar transport system substrate-binding protein|nr:autoinducer 2 ABC transporter substrate-binding protein [Christensenellaceae bacterium]
MKKLLALVLALMLALAVVACASPSAPAQPGDAPAVQTPAEAPPAAPADTAEKVYNIALIPKDATQPWFQRMNIGVKQFADDTGHNAFFKGPESFDAALQAQVVDDLVAQGVDAIVICPIDPGAVEPALKRAREAGIVVIGHEGSSVENLDYDIEAFSNQQYGAFIMDNLADAMGEEGTYVQFVSYFTTSSHQEWADAGLARQQEAYPNMHVLEAEPRVEVEGSAEIAYQKAKEILKKYPEVKGFFGCGSRDAPGAARAIEELGLQGKVFASGTGMPNENAAVLKRGTIKALTLWDPARAGYAGLELAVKVLNGEEIAEGIDLTPDGYQDLTWSTKYPGKVLQGTGWLTVTAENVDGFGF